MVSPEQPFADRLVARSLRGGIPVALFFVSLLAGTFALLYTPREEEPQIVVPTLDVLVTAPGLSAAQVARQVTIPLEKLLTQIPGVEHVYSSSMSGRAVATLRFYVGEDREKSILNTYNKIYSNQDKVPEAVSDWLVRAVDVDDVPILLLALWSEDPERYSDFALRRMADELSTALQSIPQTSEVTVSGGRPRTIQVLLDAEGMAARKTSSAEIVRALALSNTLSDAGEWTMGNQSIEMQSGDFLRSPQELESLLVNVIDGMPVYLRDVAAVVDGPSDTEQYTWIRFAGANDDTRPMVAISIAKQKGQNAVRVARAVHEQVARLSRTLLPPQVHVEVLRDYGETANEKVNNLSLSLGFAMVTVVIFIGVFLGLRPALVVGLAIPICYGFTLALDFAFGYTINRVTLFALILSLGLLVDDPITGVDNIERFLRRKGAELGSSIVAAMAEIRTPLIMSTVTIVLAFVPLAFITGMMGPYMAPMAFNVPVSVIASTGVAFLVTPWLASKLLRPASDEVEGDKDSAMARVYQRLVGPLLRNRRMARATLWLVAVLFLLAAVLPAFRLVPLKLLPFDNKSELQLLIEMPESSSLELTAATAHEAASRALQLPEVNAVAAFVGLPSPVDFSGMVRRYNLRNGSHQADLRITLADKSEREHQSHAILLRLRERVADMNRDGILVKVVEVPPGPPVLSTLVAELYAGELTPYEDLQAAAGLVMDRLAREAHVVEVDSSVEQLRPRQRFIVDKQKAALSGVATEDINAALSLANQGHIAAYLQLPREAAPLPIEIRLPRSERASENDFLRLHVKARPGIVQRSTDGGLDSAAQPLVAIGELGQFETQWADRTVHRKDLQPVVYVFAELSGRQPAEVISDLNADFRPPGSELSRPPKGDPERPWQSRSYLFPGAGDLWSLPEDVTLTWAGEGEWKITLRVFRDMGLAFAFALLAIFFVLRLQTDSTTLSLIIMSSIPLTIIGIMPGFWLVNLVGERWVAGAPDPMIFAATAMIGMIALAGIVVRNSLILVEFITQARAGGLALRDALLQAGAVRMRPVLLTAGTTLLGNLVILLDPVFSGLGLAIIFGIIASTGFTLVVVPVVYLLVFESKPDPAPVHSEPAEGMRS